MTEPRTCVAQVVVSEPAAELLTTACGAPAPNHQLTIGGAEVAEQVLPVCDEHYDALKLGGMAHGASYPA